MTKLDNFNKIIMGGQEIDRIYTGRSLIWKSNVEYERYNSLLEYTWRQYNTTLQYSWRQYNLTTQTTYVEKRENNIGNQGSQYWYTSYSFNTSTGKFNFTGTRIRDPMTMKGKGFYYGAPHLSGNDYITYGDTNDWGFSPHQKIYSTVSETQVKGSYRGTVKSTSSTAYPTNGKSGSYWYDTRTSSRVKSTYRGTVKSTNSTAYPTNGSQGTYWYDTRTSEYIKGSYIDIVEAKEGTLPNGGRHTDGYWYVLKG